MSRTPCLVIPTETDRQQTHIHAALDQLQAIGIDLPAIDTGAHVGIILKETERVSVTEAATLDSVDTDYSAVDVYITVGKENRDVLRDVEDHLLEAGVTFDTGSLIEDNGVTRHWSLDFSLDGGRIEWLDSGAPYPDTAR